LGLTAGIIGGLMAWVMTAGWAQVGPGVGDVAPDIALKDLSGQPVRLSDFRGRQPVLLMFFSTH